MHKVQYATLMFPPIPAASNDKQKDDSGQIHHDSVNKKEDGEEKLEELPFDRQLITLNSKQYEFTDSELDLYCRSSSSSSNVSDGSDEVFSEGEYLLGGIICLDYLHIMFWLGNKFHILYLVF